LPERLARAAMFETRPTARHRKNVDDYLHVRRQEAETLRLEIEATQLSRAELRAKLLARKAHLELADASPGK
jgi:hypothetical protein